MKVNLKDVCTGAHMQQLDFRMIYFCDKYIYENKYLKKILKQTKLKCIGNTDGVSNISFERYM